MAGPLSIVLSAVGLFLSEAPQVERMIEARQNDEVRAAFNREVTLYRGFTSKKNAAARLQTQLAIQELSEQMPARAKHFIPPLMSAQRQWEIDMSAALVDRELEPPP